MGTHNKNNSAKLYGPEKKNIETYFYDPEFKVFFKRVEDRVGAKEAREFLVKRPEILVKAFLGEVNLKRVKQIKQSGRNRPQSISRTLPQAQRAVLKENIKVVGTALAVVNVVGLLAMSCFSDAMFLSKEERKATTSGHNVAQVEVVESEKGGNINRAEHEEAFKNFTATVSSDKEIQKRFERFLEDSRKDPTYEGKRGTCIYYDSISIFSANAYYYMLDMLKSTNSSYYEMYKNCYSPMTIAGRIQREGSGIINNKEDANKNYLGPLQMGLEALQDTDRLAYNMTGKRLLTTPNLQSLTSVHQLNDYDKQKLNDPEYASLLSSFLDLNFLRELNSRSDTKNFINKDSVIDVYMMGSGNLLNNTTGTEYKSSCPKYNTLIKGFGAVAEERYKKILTGEEEYKGSVAKYLQKINNIQESYDEQRQK